MTLTPALLPTMAKCSLEVSPILLHCIMLCYISLCCVEDERESRGRVKEGRQSKRESKREGGRVRGRVRG